MARIRTIKPEFFVSAQVADVSTTARLLFIGMWLFCDDAGRHPANCKQLKMEVFPGDEFSNEQMRSLIDELIEQQLLIEYDAEYESQVSTFWQVTGWHHQKIERKRVKYPDPKSGEIRRSVDDTSTTHRRHIDDQHPFETTVPETTLPEEIASAICVEPDGSTPANGSSDFGFPTRGGKTWYLPERKLAEYRDAYAPDVNVDAELRMARQWLRDNKPRRKSATGMPKFLTGWLNRAADRAPPGGNGQGESIVDVINEINRKNEAAECNATK